MPSLVSKTILDAVAAKGKADNTLVTTLATHTKLLEVYRHVVTSRGLAPLHIDEPPHVGGQNTAGAPSEVLLGCLNSCLSVGLVANAVAQGIRLTKIEVDSSAPVNLTAVWGVGDLTPKPLGFTGYDVAIKLEASNATPSQLDALVAHGNKYSPVANTLRNGVNVTIKRVRSTQPPGAPVLKTTTQHTLAGLAAGAKADNTVVKTLAASTKWLTKFQNETSIRDLEPFVIDEPALIGGTDTAVLPSEGVLGCLGACISVGIVSNAVARGFRLSQLELHLDGDLNNTAAWGTGDLTPTVWGFTDIRVQVELKAENASEQELDDLVAHAFYWSPVANTLINPVNYRFARALPASKL
jgi:uncharacterized OsmC-like protein